MEDEMIKFPNGFVWGASTAAHQIEGGNVNDWSVWEHKNAERLALEAPEKFAKIVPDWEAIKAEATNPQNYISGKATDHYNRYKEDVAIMKSLGLKAFRFSIEWSRIEPKQGQINKSEIQHYRNVIQELKQNGIEPWVTLWHRTNPVWVADIGDWQNKKTVDHYLNFVELIVGEIGEEVKNWMPLNEPIMSLAGGYLGAQYPPAKKSLWAAFKVFKNFVRAQKGAYKIIHKNYRDANVGLAHAAVYVEPYKNKWFNKIIVGLVHYFANWKYINAVKNYTDFIGIQYYTRGLINLSLIPKGGRAKFIEEIDEGTWHSDMGWEIYPQGIYFFIKELSERYNKPLYITENGVTDHKDQFREKCIKEHLAQINRAIQENCNVKGYFYWSLLDNLEWDKGFWPRFGLVEVDYKIFSRKIRLSAIKYAEIIKNNGFKK